MSCAPVGWLRALALGCTWAATAIATAAPPASAGAPCVPAAGEAAMFADKAFKGACRVLKPGVYLTAAQIGVGKNGPASVRLGSGTFVQFCGFDTWGRLQCSEAKFDSSALSLSGLAPVSFLKVVRWPEKDERCELAWTKLEESMVALAASIGGSAAVSVCLKLPQGDYPDVAALGLIEPRRPGLDGDRQVARWRDTGRYVAPADIRMVFTGLRARARVCSQPAYGGACSDVESSRGWRVGEPLRSLRVGPVETCHLPTATNAVLHAGDGAWGRCAVLGPGDYPTTRQLRLAGAPARTVTLSSDVGATACSGENLQGDCREVAPGGKADGADVRSLQLRTLRPASAPGP